MVAVGLMIALVAAIGFNLGIERPVAAANGVLDAFKCYDALGSGSSPPDSRPAPDKI